MLPRRPRRRHAGSTADARRRRTARLGPIRDAVVAAGRRLADAARAGDARAALDALGAIRVLCAHRRGPYGVAGWTAQIERWLAERSTATPPTARWYVGRPLLVTENDYGLRLFNGDTGVVVRSPTHGAVAAFERAGSIVEISPRRLAAVDTVHAMTIHKSQGSQFDTVAVVCPSRLADPDSRAALHGRHPGTAPRHRRRERAERARRG